MIMITMIDFSGDFPKHCVLWMLSPIFKTILRENIVLIFCPPTPKWGFQALVFSQDHLPSEGQTWDLSSDSLTLRPVVVLSSWPWCLKHVNNDHTSQEEISSMRGTDKMSWEFKEGRSGLWMRATGKACDKVILFCWPCAPDDSRERGGGIWTVGVGWSQTPEGCVCVCVCVCVRTRKHARDCWGQKGKNDKMILNSVQRKLVLVIGSIFFWSPALTLIII